MMDVGNTYLVFECSPVCIVVPYTKYLGLWIGQGSYIGRDDLNMTTNHHIIACPFNGTLKEEQVGVDL